MSRSNPMKSSSRTRGAALIEAIVSLGVLGIGTAAVVTLVTEVNQTSTKSTFHAASLNLFASFSAQVRNSSCDVAPGLTGFQLGTSDRGLAPTGLTYLTAPVDPTSALQLVGDFIDGTAIQGAPPMNLAYRVRVASTPIDAPPSLEIEVRIREITRDPVKDAATTGYWIRDYTLTKVCTLRNDREGSCGSPPCGRGEFY